jgi:hypothetical protein
MPGVQKLPRFSEQHQVHHVIMTALQHFVPFSVLQIISRNDIFIWNLDGVAAFTQQAQPVVHLVHASPRQIFPRTDKALEKALQTQQTVRNCNNFKKSVAAVPRRRAP